VEGEEKGPSTKPSSEKEEDGGVEGMVVAGEVTSRVESEDERACVSSCAVRAVMDGLRGIEVTELKRESRWGRV